MRLRETDLNGARDIGESIRTKAALGVTVSIGIASFPRDASSADDLLKTVREAIDAGKTQGGDTVLFRRPTL